MDFGEIKSLLTNNDDIKVLEYLKRSYKIKICEKTNEPECINASKEDIEQLQYIITSGFQLSNYLLLKEAFRCLRNCIIKNLNIQKKIIEYHNILDISKDILYEDKFPLDLKNMLLTFLINVCIGNKGNSVKVWKTLISSNLTKYLENEAISDKIYALIYNILLTDPEVHINLEFISQLLSTLKHNAEEDKINEFADFTLDLLLKNANIFLFYNDIKIPEDRILILQHLRELQLKKEAINWTRENVTLLSGHFKEKSDCILKTVANYVDKIEPYEVSLLADVVASITSDEKLLKLLQYDRSLLINCAFLLKSIHDAGKQGGNHFSPIGKLAKVAEMSEEIKQHPAFGFRVNMIRILGNLAWKCPANQDEMRELDIIPLLLDCCNIDGRNPFIIQWVVFSIRNLCENNIQNQQVIAALNKQGVVDSAMLTELGLTLHDDGANSINIVPLKLN